MTWQTTRGKRSDRPYREKGKNGGGNYDGASRSQTARHWCNRSPRLLTTSSSPQCIKPVMLSSSPARIPTAALPTQKLATSTKSPATPRTRTVVQRALFSCFHPYQKHPNAQQTIWREHSIASRNPQHLWLDPKSPPEMEVQEDLLNVKYTCHRTATFTPRHSRWEQRKGKVQRTMVPPHILSHPPPQTRHKEHNPAGAHTPAGTTQTPTSTHRSAEPGQRTQCTLHIR